MIRIPVLVTVLAALAASDNDATQNELRRASEARAREAAYQQQAYAPNLGAGGIDVHAAGQRLADDIRAREQADAAERAASAERSRQAFAAIAARQAAEAAEERRAAAEAANARNHRQRALQHAWSRRMDAEAAALAAIPAAARNELQWRRLCAAELHQWDQTGNPDHPKDDPASRRSRAIQTLEAASLAGGDAARAALAVCAAGTSRQLPQAWLANLEEVTGSRPGEQPRCALLLAHARAGLVLPAETRYVSTMEEMLHDGAVLYVRLGMDLLRRIESAPLPASERERISDLLAGVATAADPALAMPARTALATLAPGRPLPGLVPLWSRPGGGTGGGSGEPVREWALLEHLLSGLVACAAGDQAVLDGLAAALADHPEVLDRQMRFRSVWDLLRREAAGWTMSGTTWPPKAYPWSPWYHFFAPNSPAPDRWSPVAGADALWRNRSYDTLPREIPWLPGDIDAGLHPIDWSAIQDAIGTRAAALAAMPHAPAPLRRAGAAIAGLALQGAAGAELVDFNELADKAAGDLRRLLLARARSCALLGTAIDHGLARVVPESWPFDLSGAASDHIDAGVMALKALALERQPDEQAVETAWIPRLAVRLAQLDAGRQSVQSRRWWGTNNWLGSAVALADRRLVGPRLASACLDARLAMADEDRSALERLAARARTTP